MDKEHRNKCIASILGFVIGDALGVPVEFRKREELKSTPVTGMIGYGTHNQPPGTWSDDTSMVTATMEWLGEMNSTEPDYSLLMDKFSSWLLYGDYTAYQATFDCGSSTTKAIMNYGRGKSPLECGEKSEYDNGNGSLMRILPVALRFYEGLACEEIKDAEIIYNLSALTHGHMRSKIGCLIYAKIIADLVLASSDDKFAIVEKSLSSCLKYLKAEAKAKSDEEVKDEIEIYSRLWNLTEFQKTDEDAIKSTGYVVDTLEAAIWCFLNTDNYQDCVLKAVNLGDDTDTVGALASGLAGLFYGIEAIPKQWVDIIPKKDWILELTEAMF